MAAAQEASLAEETRLARLQQEQEEKLKNEAANPDNIMGGDEVQLDDDDDDGF